jgi:hypothetical protein
MGRIQSKILLPVLAIFKKSIRETVAELGVRHGNEYEQPSRGHKKISAMNSALGG